MKKLYAVTYSYVCTDTVEVWAESIKDAEAVAIDTVLDDTELPLNVHEEDIDIDDVEEVEIEPATVEDKEDD